MVMSIEEFGVQLVKTGDLDPVYIAVHNAKLDRPTLHRLVLAYWCFYSLAAAARLAEVKQPRKYWEMMMEAAAYSPLDNTAIRPWPRGGERRHYRGSQAIRSVAELAMKYTTATDAIEGFVQPDSRVGGHKPEYTYGTVSRSAMSHRGFGEWIAFKIADMSERVLGYPTDFSDCHLGIYKDPRQGAAVAYQWWFPGQLDVKPWDYPITNEELERTVKEGVRVFRKLGLRAPPDGRQLNVQEVETIFCKYKSYLKGHYPPGKDIREISHGLQALPSQLGDRLLAGMPKL